MEKDAPVGAETAFPISSEIRFSIEWMSSSFEIPSLDLHDSR